jgi:hypothetical protein
VEKITHTLGQHHRPCHEYGAWIFIIDHHSELDKGKTY